MLFEFVRTWKCYVFFIRKFGSSDKENKEIYKQVLNYEQDTVSKIFSQLIFDCRSYYDVKILNSLIWELAQVCFGKKKSCFITTQMCCRKVFFFPLIVWKCTCIIRYHFFSFHFIKKKFRFFLVKNGNYKSPCYQARIYNFFIKNFFILKTFLRSNSFLCICKWTLNLYTCALHTYTFSYTFLELVTKHSRGAGKKSNWSGCNQ